MTQQHSPEQYNEPWVQPDRLSENIDDARGHTVISTDGWNSHCIPDADICERIVACVNACQGISNEELEAGVMVKLREK